MRIENAGLTPEISKQKAAIEAMQPQPITQVQATRDKSSDDTADRAAVIKAVDDLNKIAEPMQTNVKFKFHEQLNEYYVEVVDTVTDEVVREIPSRKVLDMYAAMTEFLGIFEDRKL